MKLDDCIIDVVMLPTRRLHKWTGLGPNVIGHYPIVRLVTGNGEVGLGEAPVLPTWGGDYGRYFGEDIKTTIHVINDVLFPALRRKELENMPNLLSMMDRVIAGYPYAKAAVDMAIHDLIGKSQGVPVYDVLGGKKRDGLLVSHSIGLMEGSAAAREAKLAVKEGIKAIKIKIGQGEKDVSVVAAVRRAIGYRIKLGVDANCGYKSVESATRAISRMSEYDLMYVEQPVEGMANLAKIAKSVKVPIVADESAWTLEDVEEIEASRAVRGISVYTTKPGGLHRAMSILEYCSKHGLKCNINGSCETGVGNAANIHLGVAADKVELPCVVPVTNIATKEQTKVAGVFYKDDIIEEPFRFKDGYIYPPRKNGLGITLDERKVEEYRSKFYPKPVIYSETKQV